MPTGNGENPRTVNGWRLPKLTVYYNFKKTMKSISLDSRLVDLENTELRATLIAIHCMGFGRVKKQSLLGIHIVEKFISLDLRMCAFAS